MFLKGKLSPFPSRMQKPEGLKKLLSERKSEKKD